MSRIIDKQTGKPWPEVWVNMALQWVKREVARDMAARDLERGINPGAVHPQMRHLRHTGRESRMETNWRWAEFRTTGPSLAEWKTRLA